MYNHSFVVICAVCGAACFQHDGTEMHYITSSSVFSQLLFSRIASRSRILTRWTSRSSATLCTRWQLASPEESLIVINELLQWMTLFIYFFLPFLHFQAYLEAFYKFCTNLGGTTADTMCPILEVSKPFFLQQVKTCLPAAFAKSASF